ncbi:MAG: LuxR C-terminal-related transcriptional regulator [Oscillospiraceae bacterium]|nr:LuxR C-terminal-related transcriptional regulator [Oscillospiraceae bacterium]
MDIAYDEISAETQPATQYMLRPRINRLLEQATASKLVYVIAGAGYGKTQAVRQFVEQQQDAIVRWVQLTEGDNIGSRYWDNLTHSISYDNPDLANKLRESGFPETLARFKQFADVIKTTEHRSHKTYLVLDDFHLIQSEQALTFAERCAYLQIPGACVIIISRTEPAINAVSLFSKGQVSIVTEDELRFTSDEIIDFLSQRDLRVPNAQIPLLLDSTKGWALAIRLFSMVLKRMPSNLPLALETMKNNIFKLMEVEAFNDFPEDVQKLMVKLSLASNLPLSNLHELFHGTAVLEMPPQLASFVWSDSFSGTDRVHPLYWEFLKSKQHILSEDERREVYLHAAQWCTANSFCLDTLFYLALAKKYATMVQLLFSYPFRLPYDTCEYFIEIIDRLDADGVDADDVSIITLKDYFIPLLYAGMGKYEEAITKTHEIIEKWEQKDSPVATKILYASYSNMVYLDMFNCTVSHEYNAPKYIKKSMEYFLRSSLPPSEATGAFFVADIRTLACLVGEGADRGEIDRFVDAAKQTAHYIAETHHSMYYGYDDLVDCELAFYRNRPAEVKSFARQAMQKASEKKQYSIEAMAAFYLMRVAMLEGDYPQIKEVLKRFRAHLDIQEFWNRQLLFDLFTGYFFVQIGLPDLAPSWLVMDEKDATSEVRMPTRELFVCVKHHIASKKYEQALTVLHNAYPREPQERLLISELILSLMTAVAKASIGDAAGAVVDFKKAYALSFDGEFEMPFIEMGRHMRPLLLVLSEQTGHGVPEEWLRSIEKKASIYAKKTAAVMNAYKREQNIRDTIQLSERELEVLGDLYHGLSRDEIAENRYLSVNTVKKILQSIYIKMDANNNVDAVRIGLEEGLIS